MRASLLARCGGSKLCPCAVQALVDHLQRVAHSSKSKSSRERVGSRAESSSSWTSRPRTVLQSADRDAQRPRAAIVAVPICNDKLSAGDVGDSVSRPCLRRRGGVH